MTDQALQTAVDILGPGGTAVSLATMTLLTYRFTVFMVRSAMWFLRRRDLMREGRPSEPPPEVPPSLGLIFLFLAGSALAITKPVIHAAINTQPAMVVSSNADAPKKDPKATPATQKCGSGCKGTYPDCKCPSRSRTTAEGDTKISGIPTSILGNAHPWMMEEIQAFADRPTS